VLVETGFKIPVIEKLSSPPAANLLDENPFETVIILDEIDHTIPALNPDTDLHEEAAVAVSGILT